MAKFKIGDIVQRGCVQYKIMGLDGDDYIAIDTLRLEHGLSRHITRISMYDDECELIKAAESKVQPIEPKFKVGDRVRRKVVDPHNPATEYIYTVFEIKNDKYCLDHNDHESWIPISYQDSLELVEEPKPKFKVGDKVRCGWSDEIFTIKMIDDYGYRLNNNMFVDFPDEKSLRLVVEEPEPKLKFDDDLNEIPYIDTLWKDTLANMVTDITKRNADSFVGRIDETLRYMDCGAYVDDARAGMRQFAKELKKRLGYE